MPKKNQKINDSFLSIGFSNKLLKKINNFRFENRIPALTKTIRLLIQRGLEKN